MPFTGAVNTPVAIFIPFPTFKWAKLKRTTSFTDMDFIIPSLAKWKCTGFVLTSRYPCKLSTDQKSIINIILENLLFNSCTVINTYWFRLFIVMFTLKVAKSDFDFAHIFPFDQIESIQGVAEIVTI